MKKTSTLINYFVPEDMDDQDNYNGFIIQKNIDDITLGDIKKNFPLQGEYIFRFKYQFEKQDTLGSILEKKQYVWLDVSSNSQPAPQLNNKIIMKATRISWQDKNSKPQVQQPVKQNNGNTQKTQINQQQQHQQHHHHQKQLNHSNSEQQVFHKQYKGTFNQVGHSDGDLMDLGQSQKQSQQQNQPQPQPQNNLHKAASTQQQQQQQNKGGDDLMDFGDFTDHSNSNNNANNQNVGNSNGGNDLLDF